MKIRKAGRSRAAPKAICIVNQSECEALIEAYVSWLRQGLSVEKLRDACELTTPFLDRHNDHLQVYATKEDGRIILSDDGYILSDLRTSGMEFTSPKRKAVLESLLNGFGIKKEGHQLVIEASANNLGQRLHSLIQAMLAINDMFALAQPRVSTFFWEDVQNYLDVHDVRYSPRVKVPGRSGFDHAIDFLIPKSRSRPERFVQVINAPNKNTIGTYLFTLSDTRDARGDGAEAYAFLNDRDRKVGGEVIEALNNYAVHPVPWSHRKEYVDELAA